MQKYMHIEGKQKGDCWRACIASIIECDLESLPDPNVVTDWPSLWSETLAICERLGLSYSAYSVNVGSEILDPKCLGGYIIAIGKSPRSTEDKRINHAVVWKNGIIHDPHPDKTGILDIIEFDVIRKI